MNCITNQINNNICKVFIKDTKLKIKEQKNKIVIIVTNPNFRKVIVIKDNDIKVFNSVVIKPIGDKNEK